jgi:SAM-dependent methyltransferase
MRQLVGRTDPEAFDLGDRRVALDHVRDEQYDTVLDFGCGCGRVARQLAQQTPRPRRYVGIDLHAGMIAWCQANLDVDGFEFHHRDIREPGFNPTGAADWLPFPVDEESCSLVNAVSVFTHLLEDDATRYLYEVARVLQRTGVMVSSWLLFDKREFPVMQPFQNALFINPLHLVNATIFDREWLRATLEAAGLVITRAEKPSIRGMQWFLWISRSDAGLPEVELPEDDAEFGEWVAPQLTRPAHLVGHD